MSRPLSFLSPAGKIIEFRFSGQQLYFYLHIRNFGDDFRPVKQDVVVGNQDRRPAGRNFQPAVRPVVMPVYFGVFRIWQEQRKFRGVRPVFGKKRIFGDNLKRKSFGKTTGCLSINSPVIGMRF
jgi:hypothetical protein